VSSLTQTQPAAILASPATTRPGRLTLVAGVLAAAATAVALAKVGRPAPHGDTEVHRVIPFAVAAAGFATVAIAERARRRVPQASPAARWLGVFALTGVLGAAHALLLATLGYALTQSGSSLPVRGLAWAEDWFFILADGLPAVVLLALPLLRRSRTLAVTTGLLAGVLGLAAVANMVTPRALSTPAGMPNPLGVAGLAPLAAVGILGFSLALVVAMLTAVGRGIAVSFARDRARRPLGRRFLGAALVALVFFVAQAALTPDGAGIGAGIVVAVLMVVSSASIALLATSAAVRSTR
jgi:hypothetical protein